MGRTGLWSRQEVRQQRCKDQRPSSAIWNLPFTKNTQASKSTIKVRLYLPDISPSSVFTHRATGQGPPRSCENWIRYGLIGIAHQRKTCAQLIRHPSFQGKLWLSRYLCYTNFLQAKQQSPMDRPKYNVLCLLPRKSCVSKSSEICQT